MPRLRLFERSPAAKLAYRLSRFRVSPTQFFCYEKPYCDSPVWFAKSERASATSRSVIAGMFVPCRTCEKCRQFRQMKWRERLEAEYQASSAKGMRTWFITLTFSETHLAGVRAEAALLTRGSASEKFEKAAYKHVQLYLKRLRKTAPHSRFRFFAIMEEGGETGREHFHLVIHEQGPRPLVKRHLDENWRSFTTCRVCYGDGSGAATYLTKYLTKGPFRPRASLKYGDSSAAEKPRAKAPSGRATARSAATAFLEGRQSPSGV